MKKLILPVLVLFSLLAQGQNYITDYHQPAILGHQLILDQRFQEAQEYLEPCVLNFKAYAEETYSLALCYAANNRTDEAIDLVYESTNKGLRDVAIFQDEHFWKSYISEEQYLTMKDSCEVLRLNLMNYHDPERIWEEPEKQWLQEQMKYFRRAAYVKHNSPDRTKDSSKIYMGIAKDDTSGQIAVAFFEKLKKEDLWYLYREPGCKLAFHFILPYLPYSYQNELITHIKEQVEKGNISPFFYARMYDLAQGNTGGETKYEYIFHTTIEPELKQKTEQECFDIGIGSKDVIYLQRRAYSF